MNAKQAIYKKQQKEEADLFGKLRETPIENEGKWLDDPTLCHASWPKDSRFLSFDQCRQPADRICIDEAGRRELYCEIHGRYRKLVAMLPPRATP